MLRNIRIISKILTLLLYFAGPSQVLGGVSDYSSDWSVDIFAGAPSYQFAMIPPGQTTSQVFKPNTLSRLGVGATWKGYGLDVSWANSQTAEQQRAQGSTSSTDYSLSIYWKMLAIDIFLQDYKGFFVDNTSDSNGVFLKFPDSKATHFGFQIYYVYSPERYSMASAFQQTSKQSDSGGSWVTSIYANSFAIDTGNYTANGLTDLSPYQSFTLSSSNIGAAGGYGYSLRLSGGAYYVSGQMLLGFGYQNRKITRAGANSEGTGTGAKATLHIGFGWTGDYNAVGLLGLFDTTSYSGDQKDINSFREVNSLATSARVFYLFRF